MRFYNFISLFLAFLIISSCQSKAENTIVTIATPYGNITIELFDDTPKHRDNFIKLINEGFYTDLLFHRVIQDFMIQGGDPNSADAQPSAMLGRGGPGYTIEAEILPHHFHQKGALAAARQGDNTNPQRRSSGSQFYLVQGRKYTREELTLEFNMLRSYFAQYVQQPENSALKTKVIKLQQAHNNQALSDLLFSYADTLQTIYNVSFYRDYPINRLKAYTSVGGVPHLDDQYTVFGQVVEGLDIIDKIAAMPTDRNDRPLQDISFTIKIIN